MVNRPGFHEHLGAGAADAFALGAGRMFGVRSFEGSGGGDGIPALPGAVVGRAGGKAPALAGRSTPDLSVGTVLLFLSDLFGVLDSAT